MKKICNLLMFFVAVFTASAQDFIIQDGVTVNTCEGTFYDTGGAAGNYSGNENITYTICPDQANAVLSLDFTSWQVEGGWDFMFIYDGDDNTAPLLYSYTAGGDAAPGYIEATSATGCLTIDFSSDFVFNEAGWSADISCALCQPIDVSLNSSLPVVADTIQNCLGLTLSADVLFPDNGLYYDQSIETSTFEWTVEGDPNSPYNTEEVSLEFTEQGIFEVNLVVTDVNDCTSDEITVWVNNPSPASYLELFPSTDEMCLGETAVINYNITHDIWYIQPQVNETEPVFLDDVVGGTYTSELFLDGVFEEGTTLDDIDCLTVWIDMEHSYLGDLTINLYGPNGEQIVLLEDQNGANAGNGAGGGFLGEPNDFDPTIPIPGVPYTYAFTASGQTIHDANTGGTLPESDMDAGTNIYGFYNTDYSLIETTEVNGTWTLEIIDTFAADNGFLFSWGIDFCDDLPLPILDPGYQDPIWTVYQDGEEVDNSSILTEEPSGITLSPEEGGLYTYSLSIMDAFGCDWTEEVEIYVFHEPDAGADVTLFCDPDYILQGEIDTDDGGYWTYLGPPGGVVTFDPSNEVASPEISVSTLGEYIFILHDNYCNSTDSVTIEVVDVIPEIIAEEEVYCNFEMNLSVANPVQTGVWTGASINGDHSVTFADPTASTTVVTVEDFGEYYFTYTFDFCNTSTTVHTEFLQEDPVIVSEIADTIFCAKTISLAASVLGQEDHWEAKGPGIVSFQDFEALNTDVSVSEYGDYTFYYYGCGGVDSVEVVFSKQAPTIFAPEFVECGFDAYIGLSYGGDLGILSVTGPGNAVYDPNDPNGTTLTVDQYGQYFISYDACDSTRVVGLTFMCELIIPNVFSPNNDGINDEFIIERLDADYYNKSFFTVFNRWGNVVYTNGNYGLNGVWWDGKSTLTGEVLSDGIYFYTLELYNDVRGVKEEYKGDISIFSEK